MQKLKYNDFNINNIELDRDSHIYTLSNNKSINFTSVTTYISEFFEKFDSLKTATKLVNTVPKYSHLTVEELLSEWNFARDHGTKVHNQIEDNLIHGIEANEQKAIQGLNWLNKHISTDKHQVFAEKIIYSEEIKLAGSIDLIIHNKETNQYTIVDWKTNAKISTSAYRGKTGTHNITSNIDDCKYNVYALQLSAYRYILEEYYNLSIYRQFIVHLKDDQAIVYLTPYLKDHIKKIFDLRKE